MNYRISRQSVSKFSIPAALAALLSMAALAGNCFAQTAPTSPAGESKPVAVITLSGYDELKQDVNFLGTLAGQPDLAAQFEPFIMGFTQGLDKAQPLGLVLNSGGMMGFTGVLCLPVGDVAAFLKNLQAFGITSADAGNGMLQISAHGQTLFSKQGTGWTYLSMMPDMLQNVPADPGQLLGDLSKEYDLGLRAHVQNIPEPFKNQAVESIKAGMDSGMKPMPNESDEKFQARKAMTSAQVEQLVRLINEVDQLTFGLSLDNKQQRALIDFVYTAVPGSKLAEQLALNADAKTNFAGFFQPDAAGMMMFASKIQESDIAQTEQMFDALRQQAQTAIDEDSDLPSDEAKTIVKSAVDDFMDALVATVKAGAMDGGAVLNISPQSMSIVAGGFIADPAKVESGLKKLAELGKEEPEMPAINWNAESHNGINFHTLSVPTPDEAEPKQLFGDTIDIAVGIGQQSVYFSLGRDCLAAAKKVIDDSAATPNKSIAPMELSVALGQIFSTIAAFEKDDEAVKMVAEALQSEATGRDHVRIVAQPIENGLRSRFEIEEGALRAFGVAVKAEQMKAMKAMGAAGAPVEVPAGN